MSGRDFLRRTNAASLLSSTALQPGASADSLAEGANNKFIQAAERLKLSGVATGATANDTDANLKNRANHTGTQLADTIVDGTVNKVYTATDKTKLGALPDNATLQTSIGNRIAATEKGAVNGVATLGGDGKVPAIQLPSYVDDVLEYANVGAFPATGESGKIYVAQDTNRTYRWSGSGYPEISASPGSTDAVTEGASNLYFTVQRVRDTLLAGVSFATNSVIAASDSFIVALGKLQAQISNRLQFDAAQTLTAGQKTQGQTNLGVDPTTLDARYNRLSQVVADTQLPSRLRPKPSVNVADCNTLTETGWYICPDNTPNAPGTSIFRLFHFGDDFYAMQWAYNLAGVGFYRQRNAGTWIAWGPSYSSAAQLDAVYRTNLEVSGYVNAYSGAPGVNGSTSIKTGDTTATGFLQFNAKSGIRAGFVGYASDTAKVIQLYAENGYSWGVSGAFSFGSRPTIVGGGALEDRSAKGVANGYASLDANGMVPAGQLPVNGSYKGSWNANTNTPTITAGVGANGDEYTVSVAGTNSITGTSTAWSVGDRAKFTTNGNKWERIPSVQAVNSVNGQTGVVVVTKSDVGLGNADNTSDANKPVSNAQQTALNLKQDRLDSYQVVELGGALSGDRNAYIDFHSYGTPFQYDYSSRIIREPGANGNLLFAQIGTGAISFLGGSGMFYNGVALATVASPALTGTPTAPTAALGTNTTQIATMAALKAGLDTKEPAFDIIDEGVV